MTPAQEAKEYAAKHQFDIEVIGRRYNLTKIGNAEWSVTVGGYPAALNAMKRYVELRKDDAPVKADGISDVDDGEQPAIMPDETPATVSLGMSEAHEFGTVQTPLRTGHVSIDDAEDPNMRALMDGNTQLEQSRVPTGIVALEVKRYPLQQSTRDYQFTFDATPRPGHYVAAPRKPFAISIDGTVLVERYATRTEAIREVRRLLSAPGATGAQYRASRISVECL